MDKVRVAREHHKEDSESSMHHASRKQDYSIETKEVNEVNKSQHNEQILGKLMNLPLSSAEVFSVVGFCITLFIVESELGCSVGN